LFVVDRETWDRVFGSQNVSDVLDRKHGISREDWERGHIVSSDARKEWRRASDCSERIAKMLSVPTRYVWLNICISKDNVVIKGVRF